MQVISPSSAVTLPSAHYFYQCSSGGSNFRMNHGNGNMDATNSSRLSDSDRSLSAVVVSTTPQAVSMSMSDDPASILAFSCGRKQPCGNEQRGQPQVVTPTATATPTFSTAAFSKGTSSPKFNRESGGSNNRKRSLDCISTWKRQYDEPLRIDSRLTADTEARPDLQQMMDSCKSLIDDDDIYETTDSSFIQSGCCAMPSIPSLGFRSYQPDVLNSIFR